MRRNVWGLRLAGPHMRRDVLRLTVSPSHYGCAKVSFCTTIAIRPDLLFQRLVVGRENVTVVILSSVGNRKKMPAGSVVCFESTCFSFVSVDLTWGANVNQKTGAQSVRIDERSRLEDLSSFTDSF